MRWCGSIVLAAVAFTSSTTLAIAGAQPAPSVGTIITVTGGAGSDCFDTLKNLKISEEYNDVWSGPRMDSFLTAHSLGFFGGERASVLNVGPTYTWMSNYGTDRVKAILLRIQASPLESARSWVGRTCWWEFSQNDMASLNFVWWKISN